MRGQYERYLMAELSNLEEGEPLIDLAAATVEDEDDPEKEKYLDSMFGLVGEGLVDTGQSRSSFILHRRKLRSVSW